MKPLSLKDCCFWILKHGMAEETVFWCTILYLYGIYLMFWIRKPDGDNYSQEPLIFSSEAL